MTDEQIEKALECCAEWFKCCKCPYREGGIDCRTRLATDALALIKRQKAEIEKLIDECGSQSVLWRDNFASVYETAKETIKAEARTEAIREFADKVTALVTRRYYFVQSLLAAGEEDEPYYGGKSEAYMQANIYIAEVLKEMTEEQE